MSDDSIDPLDGLSPSRRIEGHGRADQHHPQHRQTLKGTVVAVHRKAGHHEGDHVLDTSVGAQAYNEVVVRVIEGNLNDLNGKAVMLIVEG